MSDDKSNESTAGVFAEQDITAQITDISPRAVKHGGMSDVYQGTWNSPDGPIKVALKVIRTFGDVDTGVLRRYRREIALWHGVEHLNVLPLCGMCEGMSPLPAMVSPWCENGDINRYIRSRREEADLDTLKFDLLDQVCDGLQYLHARGIVHGDLKGANVLVSDAGVPRICDFGFSGMLAAHSASLSLHSSTFGGTFRWMEPQLLTSDSPRPRYHSDIWAFGCLFLEVQSGLVPYHDIDSEQGVIVAIWKKRLPTCPPDFPDVRWKLILGCWEAASEDYGHEPIDTLIKYMRTVRLVNNIERQANALLTKLRRSKSGNTSLAAVEREIEDAMDQLADLPEDTFSFDGANDAPAFLALLSWMRAVVQYSRSTKTDDLLAWTASIVGSKLRKCVLSSDQRTPASELRPIAAAFGPPLCDMILEAFGTPLCTVAVDDSAVEKSGPMAFIPGTQSIAAAASRGLQLWDLKTGDFISVPAPALHEGNILSLAAAPNGRLIASGSDKGIVRFWDSGTGEGVGEPLEGHRKGVASLAFSHDSAYLASGGRDGSFRLRHLLSGRAVSGFMVSDYSLSRTIVAFSSDGSLLAVSNSSDVAEVWNVAKGERVLSLGTVLESTTSIFHALAFTPNGRQLLVADEEGTVRFWDLNSGLLRVIPSSLLYNSLSCVLALSPDARLLALNEPSFRLQYTATGDSPVRGSIVSNDEHTYGDTHDDTHAETYADTRALAFSPDSRQLARRASTKSGLHRIELWDCTDDWKRL